MGLNWTGLPGPDQLSTPCIRTGQGSWGSGRTLGVTTLCGGVSVSVREDEILLFVTLSDMGVPLTHVSAVGCKADGRDTSWVNASGFVLKITRHVFVHAGGLHGEPSAQVHQVTCDGEAEAHTGTLGHGRVRSRTAGSKGGRFVSQTYGLNSFHSLYLQEPRVVTPCSMTVVSRGRTQ